MFGQLYPCCLKIPVAALSLVPTPDKSLGVEGGVLGDPNEDSSEFSESITASFVTIICMHTYICDRLRSI